MKTTRYPKKTHSARSLRSYINAMSDAGHSAEGIHATGLAAALRALPTRLPHECTTLGDVLTALGERATALVLMVFSIPAIVPTPGVPAGMIFGTALALLALQMISGAEQFGLPDRIANFKISRRHVAGFVNRSAPKLDSLERRLRPRWDALAGASAFRPLGVIVFLMAALIALPIPFGNLFPGIAVFLIALGLAQQDGGAVAVGFGFAVLACVFSGSVLIGSWWIIGDLMLLPDSGPAGRVPTGLEG